MNVIVPSIPHTGSHTVFYALLDFLSDDRKLFLHCESENMGRIRVLLETHTPVMPMRDPVSVARTWKGRGKSLSELWPIWDTAKNEIHKANPIYIPVDCLSRDLALDAAENRLGASIRRDWPVVRSQGLRADLTEEEAAQANKYRGFYGECCTSFDN